MTELGEDAWALGQELRQEHACGCAVIAEPIDLVAEDEITAKILKGRLGQEAYWGFYAEPCDDHDLADWDEAITAVLEQNDGSMGGSALLASIYERALA